VLPVPQCHSVLAALGTPRDNSAALTASFQQLDTLLRQAKSCGLLAEAGSSAKRNLGSTLLQQLQQSGLPQPTKCHPV
jgi:O-succinylbenzoate synthase